MTKEISDISANSPLPREKSSLGDLLEHYWRLLRKYYPVLLVSCLICLASAYFWTQRQQEIYRSTSKLIFHQSQGEVFGRQIDRVDLLDAGGRWQFQQFWNTQREVLRSRWFIENVVKREGLLDRPGFLPPPQEGQQRSKEEKMEAAVNKTLRVSKVQLQVESRVGLITVETGDPQLSADIANGMAAEYTEYTREFQSSGLKKIVTWFDSFVADKEQELRASQSELQEFMRDNNILSFSYEDRQNLTASQMEAVSEHLTRIRGKLAEEEGVLEQIQEMEASDRDLSALAGLLERPAITDALRRRSELREKMAGLRARYLESHPEVQSVTERLGEVNAFLESEIDRSRAEAENRVSALRKTEIKLENELGRLKSEVFALNELGVKYNRLKSSTENVEELYKTVLKRSGELDINSLYESNDIQVLEEARPAQAPVSPSLPLNMAAGMLVGLVLGAGLIVIVDALDTTIRAESDVAEFTQRPILAKLPALNKSVLQGLETIGESAGDTITFTAPKSSFAESIKALRTNLTFMSPDNPPCLLLVTSPGPGEGKTLCSVNMAIAMAQSGLRTLIVDTDMRRPRLHKAVGVSNDVPGLSSAVTGSGELSEFVQGTRVDNLDVLVCGQVPPNPSELLHSDRFHHLVEDMRAKYDRVIFDSPPITAVADALILSNLVDGALLILKFGKTRRETLAHSVEQLEAIGAPLMGCVINNISRSAAGYSYAYYKHYSYYGEDKDDQQKGRMAS